jgi:N-acetylglucosamine kinase-like BadF-type ATPase
MQFKARIKSMAQKNQVTAQAVLQNYMMERLLERISISNYKHRFILKGGMLIASIVGIDRRTTMDMDTTLQNYPLTEDALKKALSDICSISLDDDTHLYCDHIVPIHEDDEYGGYRAAIITEYGTIRTPLK